MSRVERRAGAHRLRFPAIATILGATCVAGCGGDQELSAPEGLGVTRQALYFRSSSLWDKRTISVCWETSDFAQEKGWVEEALRGQRSWASMADVRFVGWGDCTSASEDIRLTAGDRMASFGLGQLTSGPTNIELDFSEEPQTYWARCMDNKLSRKDCITTMALHEFGHALSFSHEQNRPDTPETCTQPAQGTDGDRTYGNWDDSSIMNYCSEVTELSGIDLLGANSIYGSKYGDAPRAGDFDGDGRADILCHDVRSGTKWIDYADGLGQFDGTDWSRAGRWCNQDSATLYKGDFNGDGRSDVLCYDHDSGLQSIDIAGTTGWFYGTDWSRDADWCDHNGGGRLLVGDFNGDRRDDLLCHNVWSGHKSIDYADSSGHFDGVADWSRDTVWCAHSSGRLLVGDFNGDGRDDLLCHDVSTGRKWVDYADDRGQFDGDDWTRITDWCAHDGASLLVGDFNGDGRDDLLCHDVATGRKWIDYANPIGQFYGTNWSRDGNWCAHNGGRLLIGDFNGDHRDDLLCHDVATGKKWIDYANTNGRFYGTDWSRDGNWCGHDSGELH